MFAYALISSFVPSPAALHSAVLISSVTAYKYGLHSVLARSNPSLHAPLVSPVDHAAPLACAVTQHRHSCCNRSDHLHANHVTSAQPFYPYLAELLYCTRNEQRGQKKEVHSGRPHLLVSAPGGQAKSRYQVQRAIRGPTKHKLNSLCYSQCDRAARQLCPERLCLPGPGLPLAF